MVYDGNARHAAQRGDGGEILQRVVGRLWVDRGCQCMRGGVGEQRMAVGLGLCHRRRTDGAAGAAAIVNRNRLAQLRGHGFQHQARNDIDGTPCRKRHDSPDRFLRPVLRACRFDRGCCDAANNKKSRARARDVNDEIFHVDRLCEVTIVFFSYANRIKSLTVLAGSVK